MPFSPELQARIDSVKANLRGGDSSDETELGALKSKLAARRGRGGYSQNAAEIEARIAHLESEDDEGT